MEQTYTASPTDRHVSVDDGDKRTSSIIDLETIPRTYAFHPQVKDQNDGRVLKRQFRTTATPDHPALVVGLLRNGSNDVWSVPLAETFPFMAHVSDLPRPPTSPCGDPYRAESTRLVVAPTANHDLVEDPPAIYRSQEGLWRTSVESLPTVPDAVTLSPGELLFAEAALVGRHSGGQGRPPGWYRFGPLPGTTVAVWHTDRPGPRPRSEFEGRSVPPPMADGSMVWYHKAQVTTAAYLVPGTERTELPATLQFSFLNFSRRRIQRAPLTLLKLHHGQWFTLETVSTRPATPQPLPDVLPGESVCWRIRLHHGSGGRVDESVEDRVEYLGGGTYAVVLPHPNETGNGAEIDKRSGALFAIDAQPVDVVPTDSLTTARTNATIEVTDRHRDPPGTLVVTRADHAERVVIAEQVMTPGYAGLRNTLPYFDESVETVVLNTTQHVVDNTLQALVPTRPDDTSRVMVRFRGQDYEIREDAG